VRDPATKETIDQALALWFPGPNSETGEDVAELQLHGGRAVIAGVLGALGRIEGLRPAEAGEFTRRAFENGKLDLTAVEGLADLVMAETEGQRRQALRQLQGALGNRAESWRQRLIQALALVEARIDFSDEADVPEDLLKPALTIARELTGEIAAALSGGSRGERLREGLTVAIVGPPNAGKSTLLNRLARREAAIVSPYAGTTRDVVEVHLDLSGLPVTLLDTAGIRETGDPVEMEGVRRACERAQAADLVLWVVDAGEPAAEKNAAAKGAAKSPDNAGAAPPAWLIRNKIDLIQDEHRNELRIPSIERSEELFAPNKSLTNIDNKSLTHRNESPIYKSGRDFTLSATTGEGFGVLLDQLARYAEAFLAGSESALVTRERHRRALEETLAALLRAQGADVAAKEDLLAEELRIAARALGRLTGQVDVEDILDVIFRDFCIGK
jgi:tRNA modification GTPase